ncbi:MAG: thioredoxin [Methanomicrobium sp.]|nr:thioredoxin [Methanomicrobium sp.]MDD4299723.1 thioredoxin [Methanomicrobium sp.]
MEEMGKRFSGMKNDEVISVNDMTFDNLVKKSRYLVADMWAEWCGPCRRVAPVIEELSSEFSGVVSFAKCNTDESPEISSRYMITAIPTLLFFSGGEICERITGAYPKESIKSRIISAFSLNEQNFVE